MGRYKNRPEKGNNLVECLSDYTVIDLETTGFSPIVDEIIEFGAIRIRNGEIVDTFQSLCKPKNELDEFIENLTHITNEMLKDAPDESELIESFIDFIGDDVIVGHNTNFDINFVYDVALRNLDKPLRNDFVDTMRISRRLLPGLDGHSLGDLVGHYGIEYNQAHRSLSDCIYTFRCYEKIKQQIKDDYGTAGDFFKETTHKKPKVSQYIDLTLIKSNKLEFDYSHPLFGKYCVFTGALQKYPRTKAAQIVADFGGICENTVTKKTNYLILGGYERCKTLKEGKSEKQKKAEKYRLKGQDIIVLPESVFYDMIED